MRLIEPKTPSGDADRAILEAAKDMSWNDITQAGLLFLVPPQLVSVVRTMHDYAFLNGRQFEMDRVYANWIDTLGGFLDEEIASDGSDSSAGKYSCEECGAFAAEARKIEHYRICAMYEEVDETMAEDRGGEA